MLTSAEISAMRTVAEATFDGTAVIQTKTFSSDGGGGGTTTWTPSGTVACHLSPVARLGRGEEEVADRIESRSEHVLTIPAETAITTEARVVVGSTTYEVTALRAPRTWEITRRVELVEVT